MRKTLIVILLLIALLLVFLPQILSTSIGKPIFERALGQKIDAKVSIGSLRLGWFGPQAFGNLSFSSLDIVGNIETLESNVPLWSLSQFGNAFLLKGGILTFPAYNNLKIQQVEAKIENHEIQASGLASQGGSFTVSGKIYSKTDFDIVANLKEMPPAPLDHLLDARGLLSAALGPSVDLSITTVYNQGEGALNFALVSPNARLTLKGQIAQDSLLLKEPLAATLHFTPELSRAFSGWIVDAKNPITLTIEPAGTAIPFHGLDHLSIGQGSLNLGQLVCQNIPPLVSFMALLNSAPVAKSTATIWFTPISFSVDKGLLNSGRLDVLIANAIHLCAWGKISLPDGGLDIILGVPADTLQNTLGIKNLSRNYVLQVPVHGSIHKPKYETGPAGAKIAVLVAGGQLTKKTGLFGPLINQITQNKDDQDVPPPNRPFPWE